MPKKKGRGWHGEPKRHQRVKLKSLKIAPSTYARRRKNKNLKLDAKRKAKPRSRFQPNWRGDLKGKRI